jgi:hypothetical protein
MSFVVPDILQPVQVEGNSGLEGRGVFPIRKNMS